MKRNKLPGLLLLYSHPILANAPTIMEHVNSFSQYSKFKVCPLNIDYGFPHGIESVDFDVILLHYSMWTSSGIVGGPQLADFVQNSKSYKISFFQDEYHYCRQRFDYINRLGINSIYTLLDPTHWDDVYRKYTKVTDIHHTLTGYVSESMIRRASKYSKAIQFREIDVGYRARALPYYMGRGAQEKSKIAVEFAARAKSYGLRLDFDTDEKARLYGNNWYKFIANCKAMIGVEAGVSIFDLDDSVRLKCDKYLELYPEASFEEVSDAILAPYENKIFYRTISPRHFEAASFHVLQILFEGQYNGILKPHVHYIPLKKDLSNFDDVIRIFKDKQTVGKICENAYSELIASKEHTYENFVKRFDKHLLKLGLVPRNSLSDDLWTKIILAKSAPWRSTRKSYLFLKHCNYPGKKLVKLLSRTMGPCKLILENALFRKTD